MRLGIFGRDSDALVKHTRAVAQARGAEVVTFDLGRMYLGDPLAFDGEEWLFGGEELSRCDGYLLRKYPAETVMLGAPTETCSGEDWFRRALRAKERSHVAQSCIMDLERRGKRMVNPLMAIAPFDQKPLQLAALRQAGIEIPRTLITNFPAAVRTFREDVGEVIYKPTGGGAETQILKEEDLARLEQIASSPVIFQERLQGPDIRVTVVAGRIISSVEIPTDGVDYRSNAAYRAGAQQYVDHSLPLEAQAACLKAAQVCGHVLSGIDLKPQPDGRYVMLEANSAPVYLDIELKTKAPITEAIVDYLLGR
jgi:glutathione synthase/RimK-type ligase-like ATP-grasp enzyme